MELNMIINLYIDLEKIIYVSMELSLLFSAGCILALS